MESEIKEPAWLGEGPLPGCGLVVLSLGRGARELFGTSFIKMLIPFMGPLPS